MDMLAMKSDRKKGALAKIVRLVSVIGMKKKFPITFDI